MLSRKPIPFEFPSPKPAIRSPRAAEVAEAFGIKPTTLASDSGFDCQATRWIDSLLPSPGKILLITGASGSGKSSLMRAIHNSALHFTAGNWVDLTRLRLPDRPIVDCFGRTSLVQVLETLSRVGLAEVWTYLRTPSELSEGQRWRLRLAMALLRRSKMHRSILACDEFAAMLDRVSAAVVARTLHRVISGSTTCSAIVVTSHEDLFCALNPHCVVRCDFGKAFLETQDDEKCGEKC